MDYLKEEFQKRFFEKASNDYNSYYKQYTVTFVKETELPIFSNSTFSEKDRRFLSKTNCKKLKMPVSETELPVAWYRGMNGFFPLFFREWENTQENKKLLGYK